jgi:hypothetical protein
LNDVGRSCKTLNYFHFPQSLSKSISSFYLHLSYFSFFVTVDNRDALLPWELMRRWKITRMCHPTVLVKLSVNNFLFVNSYEQKKKFNIQNDKVSIDWVSCMTNFHAIYHHRIQHKTTFCCSTQIHLLNIFLLLFNLYKLPSSLLVSTWGEREERKHLLSSFLMSL